MYTVPELIKAAPKLGYSPVLVEAALRWDEKDEFTLEEAEEKIKKFAEEEDG